MPTDRRSAPQSGRDKKKYHRATSDIENSDASSEDSDYLLTSTEIVEGAQSAQKTEERKQLLKNAILRRNQIIRQQKEQKAQRRAAAGTGGIKE